MNNNYNIIELLRTIAHRTDPDRVSDAEQALQAFSKDAIHALTEALEHPDDRPIESR